MTEKVTDTERVILDLLGEKPDMTYDELAEAIKTSRKTISERIKNLKNRGLIIRQGSAKKGYWIVVGRE